MSVRLAFTRTLYARFLLALVLVGIIPLGLIGLGIAVMYGRAVTEQSARELIAFALGLSGQLDVHVNGLLEDSRAIASLPDIISMDRTRQDALLKELFHQYPNFARLSTFDRSGELLASSHPGTPSSIAFRDSFQTAAERGHQSWMAATTLSTGRSSLLIHTPIRNAERRVIGVLGAVVDLENFSAVLERVPVGAGGRAFVLDVRGRALLHPNRAVLGKQPDYSWVGLPTGGLPAGPAAARYDSEGEARFAGYALVPNTSWTVVVERPEAEILLPAKRSWRIALAGLGISVLLAISAAAFLACRLTRPVTELARAAGALAAGEPSGPLLPMARDGSEIGLLVEAFDSMRRAVETREEALKASYKELQILHEISQSVLHTIELRPLLETILEKTLSIGPFDIGAILLLDPSGQLLEPLVWHGFQNGRELRTHRVSNSTSGRALGRVLRSSEPAVFERVDDWEGMRTFKREGVRSAIVLPVRGEEEILGVIHLGSRTQRTFEPQEIRLLEAIGNLTGIAAQKARLFDETQLNLERIRALREIDQAITSTLDLRTVLDVLLEKIDLIRPRSVATARLVNRQTGEVEPIACRNIDEKEWKLATARPGETLSDLLPQGNAPVIIRNAQTDPRSRDTEFLRKHGLVSCLRVPLIAREELLGVLTVFTREERDFSSEEVEFLTAIGGQAAIAIHNSQLYEEMAKLAGDLARSNRVKDEFLSVMSHELRTPLNVVMGYIGLLSDGFLGEVNPKQKEAVDKVLSHTKVQLAMVNNILQATQLEAETGKIEIQGVQLSEFLRILRSDFCLPRDKQLEVIWDYPSDLPLIRTDSGKLKQILQNLINNAIKFTERGCVAISVRCDSEAETIRFQVADTGIGIPEDSIPAIFEMFRQVDSSETRSYGGVGLGLYIVKKFTDLLGGTIEVDSAPGKGSTFTVVLPLNTTTRYSRTAFAGDRPSVGA
ncbi:MAG: GAF domain-containing protein [Deltaproteobacteria bacterium]|nr:GAF domain-containing protein [Deltaproteobacteria bacterium]